jgi:flagellar basal body L-ring protein FlgH
MKMRLRTFGLAAVAALSVLALAQDAVSLKRTAKVGDVIKFTLKADLTMSNFEGSYTGLLTEKVTKIDENGNIWIEGVSSDGKVTFGGNEIPINDVTAVTTVYKPTGEVVEVKASGQSQGNEGRVAAMQTLYIPDKPVKVGDTWETEIKPDAKLGTVALKGAFKVEAAEKVDNYDTFRIKASVKETSGDTPWTSDSTVWLNTKDGSLVKASGTWKNAPLGPAGAITDATFTMTREGDKS